MKLGNGEKSPQELAAALNSWARESGEALKSRVEEEVKRSVAKMGFAKESDLKRIESEIAELRAQIKKGTSASAKKANPKPRAASLKNVSAKNNSRNKGGKK
jgi:hypothetical protein